MNTVNEVVGYCSECGAEVTSNDAVSEYQEVYECHVCGHPHSKDELWEDVPNYIRK